MNIICYFQLFDGTRHATLKLAKEHCREKMCDMLDYIFNQVKKGGESTYSQSISAVETTKYDQFFRTFLAWRAELEQLIAHEIEETGEADED